MPPRSSVTVFDLGFRSGNTRAFLDQVDMGIDMGGLVKVNQQSREAEYVQLQTELAALRADHDVAGFDLQDFFREEKDMRAAIVKLQQNLEGHIKLAEDAWARRYINVAVGLELTIKNLRIELAVRFRDARQKVINLLVEIRAVQGKLSVLEFNILQTETRLRVITSQLRPVSNLNDVLNNV